MNIIQLEPSITGSRPPIQSWTGATPPNGYAAVASDCDTSAMQTHKGHVDLTIERGIVTAITGNDEAYQAYLDSLPPPVEPEPTMDEIVSALIGPEPTLAAAQQTRRAVQMFVASLPEEQALAVSYIFPEWEVNHKYTTGDIISYGKNSVEDPQLYKIVQDHTSSEEWKPDAVPSLYDAIGLDSSGYPVWSQPSGAHDAYNKGDIVNYNGTLYESLINGNTWTPDAYPDGWKIYSE